MRSVLGLLTIIFFFCDVRIHASSSDEAVIQADATRKHVTIASNEVWLDRQSLIEKRDSNDLRLVKGRMLIEGSAVKKISTPFAWISCQKSCMGLIDRDDKHVLLRALSGEWQIQRTGENRVYGIQSGQQIDVGQVTSEGFSEMDFVQTFSWKETVKDFALLKRGKPEKIKEEIADLMPSWKKALEAVAAEQEEFAKRNIASHEASLATERAKQAARAREDESLRKLFRERTGY